MSDDPFFGRIVSIATGSSVVRTSSTLFPILFPCCLVPLTVCRVNVSWELLRWSFSESQLYLGAHKYLIRVWITTWIILTFPMLTCPFKQAGETFFIAFSTAETSCYLKHSLCACNGSFTKLLNKNPSRACSLRSRYFHLSSDLEMCLFSLLFFPNSTLASSQW